MNICFDWLRRIWNRLAIDAPTPRAPILYVIGMVLVFSVTMGISLWPRPISVDSAKWALSTQVQSTAAVLAFFFAIGAFRWNSVMEQERRLKDNNSNILKKLSTINHQYPVGSIIKFAYDDFSQWICNQTDLDKKVAKDYHAALGRLWVIRRLSSAYKINEPESLPRFLSREEISELGTIRSPAGAAAIKMYEDYFSNPSRFTVQLHSTLQQVTVFSPQNECTNECITFFASIVETMQAEGIKTNAVILTRFKTYFVRIFYINCVLLAGALLIGLVILAGLHGERLTNNALVGVPICMTTFGLWLALHTTFETLR